MFWNRVVRIWRTWTGGSAIVLVSDKMDVEMTFTVQGHSVVSFSGSSAITSLAKVNNAVVTMETRA
jgi:hypothetical protein